MDFVASTACCRSPAGRFGRSSQSGALCRREVKDLVAAGKGAWHNCLEVCRLPASTCVNWRWSFTRGEGGSHRRRPAGALELLETAQIHARRLQLNVAWANYYMQMDPPRWAEAAHYWSIALAIRPEDVRVAHSWPGRMAKLSR